MKYAIFVSLSGNVIHEFVPFINSLDYFEHKVDLIVLYKDVPKKFRTLIESKDWSFNIKFVPLKIDENDKRIEKIKYVMCVYRFAQMAEMGVDYDACLLMDIDMVMLSNVEDILGASVNGMIFGAKNAKGVFYEKDSKRYIDLDGKSIVKNDGFYWNNICTIPLFINVKKHGDLLKKVTEVNKNCPRDDYQLLNFCIHQMGKSKYVFPMENSHWIGTEMSWFKEKSMDILDNADITDTRYRKGVSMITHKGNMIRTLHGHWWYNPYIEGSIAYRIRKVFKELYCSMTEERTLNDEWKKREDKFVERKLSILRNLIMPQFINFFFKGKIKPEEILSFTHPKFQERLLKLLKQNKFDKYLSKNRGFKYLKSTLKKV